jgi:tRNA pseudouridine38-40 synthase
MIKNYALVLEYDGSNYCGWQRQSHSPSVQEDLECSLSKIANHPIEVVCAGRTDTGVHATAQVVNFSSSATRSLSAWLNGVNANLPKAIKVTDIVEVDEHFSARFTAKYRRYNYVVLQRKSSSPIFENRAVWERRVLNLDAMNQACQYLLGEQDFSAFRSSQCQSHSPNRYIHHAFFKCSGDFVIFDIKGNAFLHHMVRNIMGSLLAIGLGEQSPEWIATLLAEKDRNQAGKTAPAHGLYLVEVGYSSDCPVRASQPLINYFI